MAWRHEDSASTSAIGLSVAAATFAIAFASASLMVEKPAGMDHRGASLDLASSQALDVIIGQAGRNMNGVSWLQDPDTLARFGLGSEGAPNFLDYRKIKTMRYAQMDAADNDAPDYADVRAALGLEGHDFHLRTYPVLPDLSDPRWTKDARGRFAYVAHVPDAHGAAATGRAHWTIYTNASTVGGLAVLNVSVAVRNDGSAPDVFTLNLGIGQNGANVLGTEQRHTRLLAPGEVQTLWFDFPEMKYTGNQAPPNAVRTELVDARGNVVKPETWTSATPNVPSGNNGYGTTLTLSAGARYYRTTDSAITFQIDHFEPNGARKEAGTITVYLEVRDPTGARIVDMQPIQLPKNKPHTYTCTTCQAPGSYVAYAWWQSSGTGYHARDEVYVSETDISVSSGALSAVAQKEVELLTSLVERFNPSVYDAATNPEGDIFLDEGKVRKLPTVLARYSTLVVGSGVSQVSLNSGDIKWTIADWVLGGGNLIVLGRESGHANWLQPVYQASISGAGGGIGAPDPTHPILTSPNRLDYQRYTDRGLAWGIRQDQPFTHVLTKGMSGNERQDALALANPGAYKDGTVVLTSYMAGALTTPQDDAEAKRFLHNLMSQSYTMLFLDYGPPVPENTPVGSAQRLVAVPHPNVPGAVVEVKIVMYTW